MHFFREKVDSSEIEFWTIEILRLKFSTIDLVDAPEILMGELYKNHVAKCEQHQDTERALTLKIRFNRAQLNVNVHLSKPVEESTGGYWGSAWCALACALLIGCWGSEPKT